MFKLSKILNSAVNVAEPCYLEADEDNNYYIGTVIKISYGIATNVTPTDKPTHVVGENARYGTKRRILCFPISPNMIFETTFSEAPIGLKNGDRVGLSFESGSASYVSANKSNGIAEIFDMTAAVNKGDTVYVRFP